MWSYQRYVRWLDNRKDWFIASDNPEPPDSEAGEGQPVYDAPPPVVSAPKMKGTTSQKGPEAGKPGSRLEIEAEEGGLENILKNFK